MEWQQSSSSPGMGFFCADGKGDFVFFSNFYWIFFYAPPPPPPKDITLLMASPLKRKVNKFPYGTRYSKSKYYSNHYRDFLIPLADR